MILYKEAEEYGILSVFHESNGSLWVIQRIFGWICYSIVNIFNIIRIYPLLLSLMTKAFEVACVFYFTSEKFEWIVSSKWMRLFIASCVLVAIPDTGIDVINCDTSSGFICMFAVFLIGLNALRKGKYTPLSVFDVLFLVLMALSSLGAPFVLGVAVLYLISFFVQSKGKMRESAVRKGLFVAVVNVALVLVATIMQLSQLFNSGRTSGVSAELFDRIKGTFLYFVWFPYSNYYYESVILTLIGILLWVLVAFMVKAKPLIVLYGAGFSTAWILMCSLSCKYDDMFKPLFDINSRGMNSRFWVLSYMIAAFFAGCAIFKLWKKNKALKVIAVIVCIAMVSILSLHYKVASNGKEEIYIHAYDNNMALCDTKGKELLFIPIGPFEKEEPFGMYVPVGDIKSQAVSDDDIVLISREEYMPKPLHRGFIVQCDSEDKIKEAYIKYDDLDEYIGAYRSAVLDNSDENAVMRLEFMSTYKFLNQEDYELYVLLESGKVVKVT